LLFHVTSYLYIIFFLYFLQHKNTIQNNIAQEGKMKLTENDMLDIEMRLARGDVRADDVRNLLAALVDMPRLLKNEQTIEVLEDEISSLELTIMSLETQRDRLEDSERELKAEIIKLNKKLEGKSE